MPRLVRLVTSFDGRLYTLPEFEVESPWWPDVGPVVEAARRRFGLDLYVLRLLDATGTRNGGEVTYAAELLSIPPAHVLTPARHDSYADAMADHELRAHWARPGGIAATLAWADERLRARGRPRSGPAQQIKSWNLSSILRLPTAAGPVWCKSVPPFFQHESAVLDLMAADVPRLVPQVLAADRSTATVLLGDVAGEDAWTAPEALLLRMVHHLVELQARWARRTDALLAAGITDCRAERLGSRLSALMRRPMVRDELCASELAQVDRLAHELPRRFASLAECGLPETLVHGDFHPGNWRSDGDALVLIDWSDSALGHPMLDTAAFFARIPRETIARARAAWIEAWQSAVPGSAPERAIELIAPVVHLLGAWTYRRFLDGIEPSEWRYHDRDVPAQLRLALHAWNVGSSRN